MRKRHAEWPAPQRPPQQPESGLRTLGLINIHTDHDLDKIEHDIHSA